MSELLRAALSADQDTPAGVDVAAVRARAGRLRRTRTRYAVAGAAAVTALAVLVPVAVVQRDRAATPVASTGAPDLTCPATVPGAPADRHVTGDLLPPGPVTGAVVCTYGSFADGPSSGRLAGTARLTASEATALAARIAAAPPLSDTQACTAELSATFALRFAGPGWDATLRVETYGCGLISNGTATRAGWADKATLRALEERAGR